MDIDDDFNSRLIREIVSIYDPTSFLALTTKDKALPYQLPDVRGKKRVRHANPSKSYAPPSIDNSRTVGRPTIGGKIPRKTVRVRSSQTGSGAAPLSAERQNSTGGRSPNVSEKLFTRAMRS
jgi:hypothetical protein